jgi:hypothetical protein
MVYGGNGTELETSEQYIFPQAFKAWKSEEGLLGLISFLHGYPRNWRAGGIVNSR